MSEILLAGGAFASALVYAIATFLMRRAALGGAGVAMQLFASGLGITLAASPMIVLFGLPDPETLGFAILAGCAFGLGQFLVTVSILYGDASVQTSLMGAKVLWVALFSALLFGIRFSTELWLAALLVVVAVFLIGFTRSARRHVSLPSIAAAIASTVSYAVTDAMLGSGRFGGFKTPFFATAVTMSGLAILAAAGIIRLFAIRRKTAPPVAPTRRIKLVVAVTGVLLASQFLAFASLLATSGQAARLNILFSSRGLFSIALVWLFVSRSTPERPPAAVLAQRAAGAVLLIVALALTV